MKEKNRKTGIDIIGDVSWGTHLCQFYQTKEDLIDILVPYFKAGLENNEFCMWVTSKPVSEGEAKEAMKKAVPDFDLYLKRGQIEIASHTEWYLKGGAFDLQRVLNAWIDRLNQAVAKGYDGIRVTGNTAWLEKRDWKNFEEYEEKVNKAIGKYQMIAICSYNLDKCEASEIINVVGNHQFALIKREGKWELIESSERKEAEEEREKLLHGIGGRVKELNCFYGLSKLTEQPGISLEKIFQGMVDLLPSSWQYPDIACARIVFEDKEFKTNNFKMSKWKMSADIGVYGKKTGIVEVYYLEEKPESYEGSFLKEEKDLIEAIAERLGRITERKKAEKDLKIQAEILDNMVEAVNVSDDKGIIMFTNRRFESMYGYNRDELIGKGVLALNDFSPEENARFVGRVIKQLKTEGQWSEEVRNLKKDGTSFYTYCHVSSLELSGKIYFIAVQEDITERKKAEEELRESELNLQKQKLALEQKNLALKEMVEHIERTKNKIKDDIAINVSELLLPILERLKIKGTPSKYVNLLQHHLEELASSFGRKITKESIKLTPREIEICSMIKSGLASKELSELLNISRQTIERHRKNIRKKLGISNKKVNLTSFLQRI